MSNKKYDSQILKYSFARSMFDCHPYSYKPWKSLKITYYKPITVEEIKYLNYLIDPFNRNSGIGKLEPDNLKWVDGQPYELIVLKGKD